jgi:hypothetical protein
MNFGCSVGDIIAVYELASKIRKQFIDAPGQFKAISDESVIHAAYMQMLTAQFNRVKSLSTVLRDADDILSERELSNQQEIEFRDIAGRCRDVLSTLEETLKKYHELDSYPKGLGKKARRVWKRLKWEPDDIRDLRSRIVANITLLNAFNRRLDR